MTDNRGFSADANASARLSAEFILIIDHGRVSIAPSIPKPLFIAGPTHKVNCATGIDLDLPRRRRQPTCIWEIQLTLTVLPKSFRIFRGSNPFFPVAPDIVVAADFKFDTKKKELHLTGSTGVFPAFEAYAQLNNGPIQTLLTTGPGKGTDVFSLIEFGTGLRQRPMDSSIVL
jgi:hypothetical protein